MTAIPRLVGMVHLLPLPGSPRFGGSQDQVVARAVSDAKKLVDAGFRALLVENFGDSPFFATNVPNEVVAAMSVVTGEVIGATGVTVGVNVLRNDAEAALAIASATGARFVRVNVLSGTMYTDQGPIVGNAARVQRLRQRLCPEVEVWADVMVKHAVPPPGTDTGRMALDTVERGGADAVIVSGSGTGDEPDTETVMSMRESIPETTPLIAGSGVSPDNMSQLFEIVDGAIIGSSLKEGGLAQNPVDAGAAKSVIEMASRLGFS